MPEKATAKRFLYALYNFVLLLVLPAILLYWAAESHFSFKTREVEATTLKSLSAAVYRLEPFSDDRRFFHVFLQKKFQQAEKISDAKFFAKTVRKNFGNQARLIVWDADGAIVPELSDEKKFKYLLHKMWVAMRDIYLEQKKPEPTMAQHLQSVAGNIELLRRFFGEFLTADIMPRPLLSGLNGEALFVSNNFDNGMLWYQYGKEFSVACILSRALKGKNIGLENITRQISTSSEIKSGYYSLKSEKLFAPWLSPDSRNEFFIEMQKFSEANFNLQKGKRFFWLFRQVSPDLFIFAARPRQQNQNNEMLQWFFSLLKYLLIIMFTVFCASLRSQLTFSIRLRFILIFSFSTGLPLLLLLSSCYEYFHFQKSNLVFARHNHANSLMREFDSRFLAYQKKLATELNELIQSFEQPHKQRIWDQEALAAFEKKLINFSVNEYILAKPEEGSYFSGGNKVDEDSIKRISLMFSAILSAMNKSRQVSTSYTNLSLGGFAGEFDLTTGILKDLGQISHRALSTGLRTVYMNFLGARDVNAAWGMLVLSWEPQNLQSMFIHDELKRFNQEFSPGKLYAVANTGRENDFAAAGLPMPLVEIFQRARKEKFAFSDRVVIEGASYIVTGMSAYHLSEKTLLAAFPDQPVFAQINRLAAQTGLGALLAAAILLLIVTRFSAGMLRPLRQLEEGLLEIQNRNFRKRLPIDDTSEFGELAMAFNTAIESMADLSLGTSVQTALLPPATKISDSYEIHSEVRYMTSMGGDFCDYYEKENKIHIAFGDVAGHGVPAALIMAMIKAYLPDNDLLPGQFLEDCNNIFLYLREKKWRRMMTLASLQICLKSGEAIFANAGHCLPILIDPDSGNAQYIVAKGIPLGSKHAKNFVETRFCFRPGQKLLFYSDGFIEDTNDKGEPFGYENFLKLIADQSEKGPAEIVAGALSANQNWAREQNDDLSLLCFYYKKPHE